MEGSLWSRSVYINTEKEGKKIKGTLIITAGRTCSFKNDSQVTCFNPIL